MLFADFVKWILKKIIFLKFENFISLIAKNQGTFFFIETQSVKIAKTVIPKILYVNKE